VSGFAICCFALFCFVLLGLYILFGLFGGVGVCFGLFVGRVLLVVVF